jgi:hypothetical protein
MLEPSELILEQLIEVCADKIEVIFNDVLVVYVVGAGDVITVTTAGVDKLSVFLNAELLNTLNTLNAIYII